MLKKKFAKLIDVRSIVTLTLTGAFTYLSITGKIGADQFLTVWTVIISFFFGSKVGKAEARDMAEEEKAIEEEAKEKTDDTP